MSIRPPLTNGCYDCGEEWSPDWLNLYIPDEAWRAISPFGDGRGHLCHRCIRTGLERAGMTDVPAQVFGGPFGGENTIAPFAGTDA